MIKVGDLVTAHGYRTRPTSGGVFSVATWSSGVFWATLTDVNTAAISATTVQEKTPIRLLLFWWNKGHPRNARASIVSHIASRCCRLPEKIVEALSSEA
jgi:hypothetical protein